MGREVAGRGLAGRALVVLAAFAALPVLAVRLDPNAYARGRSKDEGARAARNTSSVGAMLGEFRTALSDIMFIKTERYLHSGVAYAPHMARELLSTEGMRKEIDEHSEEAAEDLEAVRKGLQLDHAHAGTATLIPEGSKDYRGFVGALQREVKPWRDPSRPHLHTDGRELLPWFRVMTLSDPHYVRGYAVGGWWLTHRNLDSAFEFVEEGLRNNPDAFEIWYTYGNLLLERGRLANGGMLIPASDAARPIFLQARDAYRTGAEHALRQRPRNWTPDGEMQGGWTDYMEEDARGAARMAVLCEKNYGRRENAVRMAVEYVRVLGPDEPLDRTIQDANADAGPQI